MFREIKIKDDFDYPEVCFWQLTMFTVLVYGEVNSICFVKEVVKVINADFLEINIKITGLTHCSLYIK